MATVKEINHDSGTVLSSHYDTISDPDGAATVTAGAALNSSTYGVDIDFDAGANDVNLKESFTALSGNDFRWRVRVDLSNLAHTGTNICWFYLRATTSTVFFLRLISGAGGAVTVDLYYYSDSGGNTYINGTVLASAVACIEVRAIRETADGNADGEAELYIDGVSKFSASNLDNFIRFGLGISRAVMLLNTDSAATGNLYYDEWILDDDSTTSLCGAAAASTEFRFLGFAADTGTLMVSGLKDTTTLQLYDYSLDTMAESGTASFGSASDADLDARTRGIFPVAKPMNDDVWYLYGRDGSNVQVQYNDRSGTLGWVDLSPGTASWGTSKYAIGLWPAPTWSGDVVVAFSDDDIWRTRFGTFNWVKMGDATTGDLRTGGRMITNRGNELVLAGASAGSVLYSPNFGVSYDDVSGTALGTINAVEVSL